MFGLKTFVAGLLLGSVTMLLAMQFHLIRTTEGFTVVPRAEQPPLRSTYVDVRRWNTGMWKNYPEVSEALIKAGREDVMTSGAAHSLFSESSESTLKEAGASINESTRKAIQALVPIRFTQPQDDVEPRTDHSEAEDSSFRIRFPSGSEAILRDEPHSSADRIERNGLVPTGLPVLQHPVPISEEALRSSTPSDRSGVESQPDWIRGLLRSLIPRENSASTEAEAEHSHARPTFELDAPRPEDEVLPSQATWSALNSKPQPAPVRAVRPF